MLQSSEQDWIATDEIRRAFLEPHAAVFLQRFQMRPRDPENLVAIIPVPANFCGAGEVYEDVFVNEYRAERRAERGKKGSSG